MRHLVRAVVAAGGVDASDRTPCKLRHIFISRLSRSEVPIEDIAHSGGHASTSWSECWALAMKEHLDGDAKR